VAGMVLKLALIGIAATNGIIPTTWREKGVSVVAGIGLKPHASKSNPRSTPLCSFSVRCCGHKGIERTDPIRARKGDSALNFAKRSHTMLETEFQNVRHRVCFQTES